MSDELQDQLRVAMEETGDTQRDVAYHAKRSQPSIFKFLHGQTKTLYMKIGIRRYLTHVYKHNEAIHK